MTPTTATQAAAPTQPRRRRHTATAKPAAGKRTSLSLGAQVLALANGKTQKEIAAACKGARPNMSASLLPGTSALAGSKSATGSSTPRQSKGTEQGVAV